VFDQYIDVNCGLTKIGKTESVKALGQALGKFVLVFCCDESFDFQAIGRILTGVCQVGAWGCFDEFNRLNTRILSAVSSQIETIELGLRRFSGKASYLEIELLGRTVSLSEETGIFITMNPQYAGRNTLPENLRKLFRSFSMAKPDGEAIAEVILYSQGFVHASELSKIMVPYFEELDGRLSRQVHYDFGLRALKNVLRISGSLKRAQLKEHPDMDGLDSNSWESALILRSLRETVAPKLLAGDIAIMLE
jgi:dynein heavy chain 1